MNNEKGGNMDPFTGMMIAQGAGQLGGMLMGGYNDRRQLRQQKELQKLQIAGAKEMGQFNQMQQLEMFNKTGYGAQLQQMKDAGLSVGLMAGKGGAGGQTGAVAPMPTGGNADGGSARLMAQTNFARQLAEIENIKADTQQKQATTTGTEFENLVNSSKTVEAIVKNWQREADMTEINSEKMNFEFNAWKDATLTKDGEGGHLHDKNSKLTKQLKEQYEATEIALQNAKNNNNIQEFEKVIKGFEASMAKDGIHPNSPWYVKLLMEVLKSSGLNPMNWLRSNKQ